MAEPTFDSVEDMILQAGAAIMLRKWMDTVPVNRFVVVRGKEFIQLTPDDLIELIARVLKAAKDERP